MSASGEIVKTQLTQHITRVVHTKNSRLRRVDDLARAVLYLTAIIMVVLLAIYAHATTQAVAQDLTTVFVNTTLATVLLLPLSMLQNLFILATPVALLIMLAFKAQWLRTFQAAFPGIIGAIVASAFTALISALPYVDVYKRQT